MAPGVFKKPILKLNRLLGSTSAKHHMSKAKVGSLDLLEDATPRRSLQKAQEHIHKEEERENEKRSLQIRRHEDEEKRRAADPPEIRQRYGTRPVDLEGLPPASLSTLADFAQAKVSDGAVVSFVARVHHVRRMSAKLAFVVLRSQLDTLQGVIACRDGVVSESMVRWAEHLVSEGLVHVEGTVQKPKEPVKGCNIHHQEIMIDSIHLLVPVEEHLPVDVFTIDRVEEDEENHEMQSLASNRLRGSHRLAYLRTPTGQSIFRINSGICNLFRSFLDTQGFIEIHTPKLQPAATESGAQVFKVNYFNRTAFLAQSPQLAKQMCISADFGRVFEIGPVFRAEDSNTHRHLTEYTGLDIEMALQTHYHEALNLIDEMLKSIFKGVYERYRRELDTVKTHFPHEDLVWLDKTPVLPFVEGVRLLNESGWKDQQGNGQSELEDLSTRAEIRLGELVKEKYGTDYYILDKFPASARPFYAHLDPKDERYTNSFDIFVRGQEIVTGGQRVHDFNMLKERMRKVGIEPEGMHEYLQAFEFGVLPHAGCGIGLERVLFLLLNLGDIRNASLFPRDPKSLPEHGGKDHAAVSNLPHPDADTVRFAHNYEHGKRDQPLPSIENLIANYGDATNTSWLDADRYQVWRHEPTGAAVGFAQDAGYALIMGNPLCDERQYPLVVKAFLLHLRKELNLRPLWLLVSAELEDLLASKLGWRSLSCVAEERVPVDAAKKVGKKQRQAEEAGVTIHEAGLGEGLPEELRLRIDERIAEWKAARKSYQTVHITEVRPWVDVAHRRYLWAEDKTGRVAALVVLHRLSPAHGYQIKFALDFPGSPSGTIEALISASIAALAKAGVRSVTFGAGATPELVTGENMNGMRARILSHTYKAVAQQLKLVQKSEFREKFGTRDEPVYICYPFMGLGVSGARTLIKFFEDEM